MCACIPEKAERVQWREWDDDSFALARKLDRPILLDIGAVWCHWCHVMEETVYEDAEVARLVNDLYVPIKVDTDRRPDINERYNQGGWPTTAFLTPEGDVLYGATYLPKDQFKQILVRIAEFYRGNRAEIAEKIKDVRAQAALAARSAPSPGDVLTIRIVQDVLKSASEFYDPQFGGFGVQGGNKFPQPEVIDFLLYMYAGTQDKAVLRMVERTLEGQALGGMYDHVGGGFHRYSVRPDWRIPHFEKMLKDQAGHICNYLDACQATGKDLYRRIAVETLGYVEETLSDPAGGFCGSQDADVGPHDDGTYFTWTRNELKAILTPKEHEIIVRYFGLDDDRNAMAEAPTSGLIVGADGRPARITGGPDVKHVLNISFTVGDLATEMKTPAKEIESLRDSALAEMRAARAKRPTPFVDTHLFTDWNAMMVSSFLRAWAVLGEERYRAFAFKALDRVLATMFNQDTGMAHYTDMRNQVSDRNLVSGFLTDQVYMVRALLDAYAAGGERRCLTTAEKLTVLAKRRLLDVDGGGFWDTAPDEKSSGNLALRRKSLAHNAVAADSLRRLWIITGNREYRELQQRTLLSFAEAYEGVGFQTGIYAQAVADFLGHPVQMVVVGPLRQGRTQALLRACASFYDPRKVVAPLDTEEDAKRIAELGYRAASGASVYICVDKVCSAPVSDPEELPVSARKFVERNLGTR